MVRELVLVMEMHQPYRIKKSEDIDALVRDPRELIDSELDRLVLERVVERSYRPVLGILREELGRGADPGRGPMSIGLSISGTLIEQLRAHRPDVIEILREMVSEGLVEIIVEPYYHSLVSELDRREFEEQLRMSIETTRDLFNTEPVGAVNTELIYRDEIGCWLRELGLDYTIVEGVERLFTEEDLHTVLTNTCGLKILVRHYRLSDDIAFRFSLKTWDQYPLTADKYAEWVRSSPGEFLVVYIDFETFGEHHGAETGIMDFLAYLPRELERRGVRIVSPRVVVERLSPGRSVAVGETISWADERKDLSAWLGNELQKTAFELYKWAGGLVMRSGDERLVETWRILGEADHYHYMYYEPLSSFLVHDYFSHYESPRHAYISYIKALTVLVSMAREYIAPRSRRTGRRSRRSSRKKKR